MQHPFKSLSRALIAVVPVAALGSWACGLINSAKAEHALAATVLSSEAYDLAAVVQLPDAGLPFALPDAGGLTTVPPQTVAEVFFGKRDSDPTRQPSPITGATVTLAFGGKTFTLTERGEGNYGLSTPEDPAFVYEPDVQYTLTVQSGGETFTAEVVGPKKERIEQFRVLAGAPLLHDAGKELKLTRGSTEDVAFVTVVPLTAGGPGEPTYTNMPTTPLDLLDLIANDSLWKQKIITIPGSAFPDAGSYYLVTIATVKKGDTSENLFTASALLVGLADMAMVQTR